MGAIEKTLADQRKAAEIQSNLIHQMYEDARVRLRKEFNEATAEATAIEEEAMARIDQEWTEAVKEAKEKEKPLLAAEAECNRLLELIREEEAMDKGEKTMEKEKEKDTPSV